MSKALSLVRPLFNYLQVVPESGHPQAQQQAPPYARPYDKQGSSCLRARILKVGTWLPLVLDRVLRWGEHSDPASVLYAFFFPPDRSLHGGLER